MKLGIIGLPNVGKSTLFNAITKASAEVANYPFCTIEPNIRTVAVPDERLDFLQKLYSSKRKIFSTIEFLDVAGLVKGASRGDGLGNQFLGIIKKTDAILHVVRCFESKSIVHFMGKVDPLRDIETINMELIFADLESISRKIEKFKKKWENFKETFHEKKLALKIKTHLNSGNPVKTLELNDEERIMLKGLSLITAKPVLYICNVAESDLPTMKNEYTEIVKEFAKKETVKTVRICAKIEEELSKLSNIDQGSFLKNFAMQEIGLNFLIKKSYELLGVETFFTAGKEEVRAWTIKKGLPAPKAANLVHSDFEKGFIRAEIMNFDDLFKLGSEKAVKEAGLLRSEGKEYLVRDGDIVMFRFNV
jgi:GTP-binding protein YchF